MKYNFSVSIDFSPSDDDPVRINLDLVPASAAGTVPDAVWNAWIEAGKTITQHLKNAKGCRGYAEAPRDREDDEALEEYFKKLATEEEEEK